MNRFFVILLFAIFLPLCATAQKIKVVSAEYTYHVPETITPAQAKQIAIERARVEAIASEFGTIVAHTSSVNISNVNGKSDVAVKSIGTNDVKGVWIGDIEEPKLSATVTADGNLVYTVKVHGKARARNTAEINLDVAILHHHTEGNVFKYYPNNRNKNRDEEDFSVKFKAAANGFVSVFVLDDNNDIAFCLLPDEKGNGFAVPVEKSKEYHLLEPQDSSEETTYFTTDKSSETDRVFVIYSTKQFSMPLTNMGEYTPQLSIKSFESWLHNNLAKDEMMTVVQKSVTIKKVE